MNVSVKIFSSHRLGLIKYLVRRSVILEEVFLLLEHTYWRHINGLSSHNLSLDHGGDPSLVVPQTNFIDITFSDVLKSIELHYFFLLHGVHLEVLIGNNHLLVELVDFLLAHLSELLDHVVARDEHGVKILFFRESRSLGFYFRLEVRLPIFSGNKCESLHSLFGFQGLNVVRNLQIVDCRLIGSLGMLIPVLSFHDIIKSILSLPSSFIFLFGLHLNLILVHDWESQTEMLSRVSVEFRWVLRDLLTELLLLEFPDIQFLVAVLENIYSLGDV